MDKLSYNGKSIGEVRAFEELKVQERPNEADAFSMELNYKKNVELKSSGGKKNGGFSIQSLTPHFANTMLLKVLNRMSLFTSKYLFIK